MKSSGKLLLPTLFALLVFANNIYAKTIDIELKAQDLGVDGTSIWQDIKLPKSINIASGDTVKIKIFFDNQILVAAGYGDNYPIFFSGWLGLDSEKPVTLEQPIGNIFFSDASYELLNASPAFSMPPQAVSAVFETLGPSYIASIPEGTSVSFGGIKESFTLDATQGFNAYYDRFLLRFSASHMYVSSVPESGTSLLFTLGVAAIVACSAVARSQT